MIPVDPRTFTNPKTKENEMPMEYTSPWSRCSAKWSMKLLFGGMLYLSDLPYEKYQSSLNTTAAFH
jgi:hypothetical protein